MRRSNHYYTGKPEGNLLYMCFSCIFNICHKHLEQSGNVLGECLLTQIFDLEFIDIHIVKVIGICLIPFSEIGVMLYKHNTSILVYNNSANS